MNTPESVRTGRSRALAARCCYYTLSVLNEQDGGSILFPELKQRLNELLDFDDWELYRYPKTGEYRWVVYLQFYSIDLVKAGCIIKKRGVWFITPQGRDVFAKYKNNTSKLYDHTHQLYSEWEKNNRKNLQNDDVELIDDVPEEIVLASIKQQAADDMRNYIRQRTPYEFQDMVAALLRGMGYYTPFVAPKGKDGGVDIIAYSDPLGANKPILKVQVKHFDSGNPVPVDIIHKVIGVAKGDTPLVVTSGRFTESARADARQNNVRLIDGVEFVELWIGYYQSMSEDDRLLMPIEPVYFVKRSE